MRTLLTVTAVLLCAVARAQGTSGGVPLAEELERIARHYGANVAFSSTLVEDVGVVPAYVRSSLPADLEAALTPFGLTYARIGQQYVVTAGPPPRITLTGFVEDRQTGERLVGATVYVVGEQRGTSSNAYGYFSLPEVRPDDRVAVRYIGYRADTAIARDLASGAVTVALRPDLELRTVEVLRTATTDAPVPLDGESLSPELLDRTQLLNGRRDVNSWLSTRAGVQSAANGYRGYGFRGADPEHNLTLLDDANLYLPSHAEGYFSIIQSEALRSWRVHRDAGPARYGDRVGGVLDLRLREGNRNARRSSVNLGISDVAATTEGPLGRGSYFLSGRRALSDVWLDVLLPDERQRVGASPEISFGFFDVAAKVNQPIDDRQQLYASVFVGRDRYRDAATVFGADATESSRYVDRSRRTWQNVLGSLRHSIALGDRWFANSTLTVSDFRYVSTDDAELTVTPVDTSLAQAVLADTTVYDSRIRDLGLKSDLQYAISTASTLTFGVDATAHRFAISSLSRASSDAFPLDPTLRPVVTLDASAYVSVDYRPSERLHMTAGLRLSSQIARAGTFVAPLPRASISYALSPRYRVFAAVAQARQYVHRISTNNPGLGRDLWVPTFRGLRPLASDQASGGLAVTLPAATLTASAYGTRLRGLTRLSNDFLGANYDDWVENLRAGTGYAYGLEVDILRELPSWTLEATYTLARSVRRFEDAFGRLGPWERARLDRRHAANFLAEYRAGPRWTFSGGLRYGSGLPARRPRSNTQVSPLDTGLPLTNSWNYDDPGAQQLQLRAFFSLDLGLRWRIGDESDRQVFTLGAQNVTLRRNPLFFNLRPTPDPQPGQGLFEFTEVFAPPVLPYLRYSRRF